MTRSVAIVAMLVLAAPACAQNLMESSFSKSPKSPQATQGAKSLQTQAQSLLDIAMESWQSNDVAKARQYAQQALALGVDESQFGVSPQFLLRKLDQDHPPAATAKKPQAPKSLNNPPSMLRLPPPAPSAAVGANQDSRQSPRIREGDFMDPTPTQTPAPKQTPTIDQTSVPTSVPTSAPRQAVSRASGQAILPARPAILPADPDHAEMISSTWDGEPGSPAPETRVGYGTPSVELSSPSTPTSSPSTPASNSPPMLEGYWPQEASSRAVVAPAKRQAFGRPGSVSNQQLVVGPATSLVRSGASSSPTVLPNVQPRPYEGSQGGVVQSGGYGAGSRFNLAGLVDGVDDMQAMEIIAPGSEPMGMAPGVLIEGSEPIFGQVLAAAPPCIDDCSKLGRFLSMFRREPCPDRGVGYERIASAPMMLDIAQPLPNTFRVRFDSAYDVQAPDRAEFIYSSLGGTRDFVDYQDVRFQLEMGGARFSTATEIPIRVLDPLNQGNTAGLGDMNITVKTVLVDGETWQITQLFRTIMNTGAVTHNLSSGHVAMEPGMLFRVKWTDETYWHGQIKYRFPIGGSPTHAGQVLQVGSAVSNLLYETDQVALIPTLECNSYFVLDGQQYGPGNVPVPVDGDMILNLGPSMRFVIENGSDLGLLEFGLGTSVALTSTRWHSVMAAIELRMTF